MILPALLVFALATFAVAWVEHGLPERLANSPSSHALLSRCSEYLLLPLLRSLTLLVFIGLAYPAIFGIEEAPELGTVLLEEGRWNDWINLAFVAGLVLPALPALRAVPGLVLPLQGLFALALLYRWLALELERPPLLLPSVATCLSLGAFAVLASLGANAASRSLTSGSLRQDLRELLLLWLQAPVLLIYGHSLGSTAAS